MIFVIYGNPITKKNSQKIVFIGKKCPVCHKGQRALPIQSDAYKQYERDALLQLARSIPAKPIDYPVNIECKYFMRDNRRIDLTNLLEATGDILVAAGIISDDNCKIIVSHDGSRVFVDKDTPRCVITITEQKEN